MANTPQAAKTASATPTIALDVRLLWLHEAMPGTLFAALDVLRTALLLHRLRHPKIPPLLRWRIVDAAGRRISTPFADSTAPRRAGTAQHRLLVIPGLAAEDAPHLGELMTRHGSALRLVQQHAAHGGWIAACFTGLVMPVHLGLLDGERISAPWPHQSWLARVYPRCDFSGTEPISVPAIDPMSGRRSSRPSDDPRDKHSDQRSEDIGKPHRVFSCVAPALCTEFMLQVLMRLLGSDIAQSSGQVLLHQPERQQIAPALAKRQWLVRTTDSPVHRAMQWLKDHIEEPYCLKDVATAAAISERSLLRQFQLVTGQTPLQHLHQIRIARAKLLLETTLLGLDAIAQACGYADTASMRRLFSRETGLSMSAHRERHTLRTPHTHWQVRTRR